MANLAGPLQEKDPLSLRLDFCAFDRREVAAGVVVCLCRGLAARTNLHWKGTLWRQIHKRIPVISGIVLRCRLEAGSDDRSQRQGLARHRFHWLRIHQAIASHPNLVIRLGQPPAAGYRPASSVTTICENFVGKFSGFRNHPHTRLGPFELVTAPPISSPFTETPLVAAGGVTELPAIELYETMAKLRGSLHGRRIRIISPQPRLPALSLSFVPLSFKLTRYSCNVSGIPAASECGFEPLAEEYMATCSQAGQVPLFGLSVN